MLQHVKGGVSTLLTSRSVVGNEITLSCQRKVISLKYYNTPPKSSVIIVLALQASRAGADFELLTVVESQILRAYGILRWYKNGTGA